jgi:hypothetical protein
MQQTFVEKITLDLCQIYLATEPLIFGKFLLLGEMGKAQKDKMTD